MPKPRVWKLGTGGIVQYRRSALPYQGLGTELLVPALQLGKYELGKRFERLEDALARMRGRFEVLNLAIRVQRLAQLLTDTTLGRSRLLYCNTQGSLSM